MGQEEIDKLLQKLEGVIDKVREEVEAKDDREES